MAVVTPSSGRWVTVRGRPVFISKGSGPLISAIKREKFEVSRAGGEKGAAGTFYWEGHATHSHGREPTNLHTTLEGYFPVVQSEDLNAPATDFTRQYLTGPEVTKLLADVRKSDYERGSGYGYDTLQADYVAALWAKVRGLDGIRYRKKNSGYASDGVVQSVQRHPLEELVRHLSAYTDEYRVGEPLLEELRNTGPRVVKR